MGDFYWCHMSIIRHEDERWDEVQAFIGVRYFLPAIHTWPIPLNTKYTGPKWFQGTNNRCTHKLIVHAFILNCVCQPNPSCSHFRISHVWCDLPIECNVRPIKMKYINLLNTNRIV